MKVERMFLIDYWLKKTVNKKQPTITIYGIKNWVKLLLYLLQGRVALSPVWYSNMLASNMA